MNEREFTKLLNELKRGNITRRQFMAGTGLATAAAVLAACAPASTATKAPATSAPSVVPSAAATAAAAGWTPPQGVDLGKELFLTTWPNYHDPKTLEQFTALTGVKINTTIFGSNEEMLAKLLVGNTGWDVLVPTNYTFETYGSKKILEPLDLARLPHLDVTQYDQRLLSPAHYPAGSNTLFGFNKDWGTTGYTINTKHVTKPMKTWKDFFELAKTDYSGKVTIHDYQLTSIGSALVALGYSFNSVKADEMAKAEALLIELKPHLFAINSDYQPPMRNGDAWIAMTWTNDAAQLNRDLPEIQYVIAADGGEIWSDFFTVVAGAKNREAAYAFLDYMATPSVAVKDAEFHGAPLVDARMIALQSDAVKSNKITYPDAASLSKLEFGTAELLTNQDRAELWARVKSA